ncbi:hypothetical protein SAMN05216266_106230 [Amycolatopsis marina]|uniref:Uncharacterized protein n=1 Tax=Amycolatopsis marina TaxID=490629 RepID=A0A1I0Z915_9PSEU|nr:hypothetical protein [Amycolatopsis marina]SFB22239.1 hypothetical protein SAMN05216266_106230 [Amycolatopsis marina]
MNAERLAFLDSIEANLTTTKLDRTISDEHKGKSKKSIKRMAVAAAVMAASASFSTLFNSTAYAITSETPVSVESSCGIPNPIPRDHFKSCGIGGYNHYFRSSWPSGPGGIRTCYSFWSELLDLGCGTDPGRTTQVCA